MRVKTSSIRKKSHKRVLKRTKGFWMTRHKLYKVAKEADLHAGQYAFIGRKSRKRDLRRLWITRINAVLKNFNLTYSRFINLLKEKKIELNRKILADFALSQPKIFEDIVRGLTLDKKKKNN